MAHISKVCSVDNALNFNRDIHESLGHMVSLKIGDTELTADLKLIEPESEGEESVVGPIESAYWQGGIAQPMRFKFYVSETNKNELATLVHTELKSLAMTFTYVVYEYDHKEATFYKCFHSGGSAFASFMQVEGAERVFYLDDQPYPIDQPRIYGLEIGISPEHEQQDVQLATASDKKFVKPWGVPVS